MKFQKLMNLVEEQWPFIREKYPLLPEDPLDRQVFSARHILLHLQKSVGAIAGFLEPCDHGDAEAGSEDMRNAIGKLFADILRLAALLKMDAGDLKDFIEKSFT